MNPTSIASFASTIALAGSAAYFSPLVWRIHRMNRIRRMVCRNRIVALTYDDGPSQFTPCVLDLLQRHRAHATFFMLGRHARLYPEIVDRVTKEGHDLGCHSDEHMNAWKVLPWTGVADIHAGYKTLSSWIPANGPFRPPYGKITLPTYWALHRKAAPVWWWTIDSG